MLNLTSPGKESRQKVVGRGKNTRAFRRDIFHDIQTEVVQVVISRRAFSDEISGEIDERRLINNG